MTDGPAEEVIVITVTNFWKLIKKGSSSAGKAWLSANFNMLCEPLFNRLNNLLHCRHFHLEILTWGEQGTGRGKENMLSKLAKTDAARLLLSSTACMASSL